MKNTGEIMNDAQNFMPEDLIEGLQFQNKALQMNNLEMAGALTGSSMGEQEPNIISYKLETDRILERVEHFLKGDQVKFKKDGKNMMMYFSEPTKNVLCSVKKDPKTNLRYFFQEVKESKKGTELIKEVLVKIETPKGEEVLLKETDSKLILGKLQKVQLVDESYKYTEIIDEDKKPLNEYGVAELMRVMSMYVTKETILSCYTEERINEILWDLGKELNKFLYCNYEKMGMDTKFKESKYILICINLLHIVESCYRRALGGAEQEYIMTKGIVTQGMGGGMSGSMGNFSPQMSLKKKWHPLKPSTW